MGVCPGRGHQPCGPIPSCASFLIPPGATILPPLGSSTPKFGLAFSPELSPRDPAQACWAGEGRDLQQPPRTQG